MKLTILLLTAVCLHVVAAGYGQKVTISGKHLPLEKVFSVIKKQTDYVCFYGYDILKDAKKVSLDFRNAEVEDVLKAALWDQGLDFSITGKTITIIKKPMQIVLKESGKAFEPEGVVTNEDGEPLAGASVKLINGNVIAITDEKGRFKLKNISGDSTIEISYTGYSPQKVRIGNRETFRVSLSVATNQLDQVQVVAYGTTTQRLSPGNITKVTSKEIEQQPVSNPLAALEGRVPGLVISQTTGAPGGGFKVQIRGQNSLSNGNDPFFVIDGVPYPSNTLGLLNSTLNNGNPLNFINPGDIESIEVLKDADATSIYGSRAANGAILITTKKGKVGQTMVNVNAYTGIEKMTRKIKLLNTEQYLQMRHEAFYNDSINYGDQPYIGSDPDLLFWDQTRYTDWQKVLLENPAHASDAQASVSGGNINTQYFFGGGYHRETTIFPVILPDQGADQKISVHSNLQTSSENKRFKLNITGTYVSDINTVQPNNFTIDAYTLPPNAPGVFNSDGSLNWASTAPGEPATWTNPFGSLYQKCKGRTSNLVGNALISYSVLPGLEAKVSLGYTNTQTDEVFTVPNAAMDPAFPGYAYSRFSEVNTHSWIVEPQAEYKVNVLKGGVLTTLVGVTFHENDNSRNSVYATNFLNDALLENMQSAGSLSATTSSAQYKYNAVFGRLNYNWHDKYILNLSARRDGSSRFGPGRQFANFGSLGTAWIFTKENFFKDNLPFLSFGKIRASYGTSGNDQIGDYGFIDLYTATNRNPYQGIQGLYPANLFNTELAWELDKKLEAGLELGMLNDKILFNASYFRNRSGNQLVSIPLSIVTGFNNISANLPAVVQNSGAEFILNTTNVRTKNFNWRTSINLSIPRNKLVSYPGLENSPNKNLLIVGQPIGIAKAFHSLGVNDSAGIYQFATAKGGDPFNPVYDVDNTVLISTAPKYYGGFQNSLQYKDFTLDFLFQFVKQTGLNIFAQGIMPGTMINQPVEVLDHWQKPGDGSKRFQQFSQDYSGNPYYALNYLGYSDFIYSDASYIRLKNLSLSYSIPESLRHKWNIQAFRVFIQGQNLLTITNYRGIDPESQGYNMPPLRVWTAGFQLTL